MLIRFLMTDKSKTITFILFIFLLMDKTVLLNVFNRVHRASTMRLPAWCLTAFVPLGSDKLDVLDRWNWKWETGW